jgi:hypothetical protein
MKNNLGLFLIICCIFSTQVLKAEKTIHIFLHEKYSHDHIKILLNGKKIFSKIVTNNKRLVAKDLKPIKLTSDKCKIDVILKNKQNISFQIDLNKYTTDDLYIVIVYSRSRNKLFYELRTHEPFFM